MKGKKGFILAEDVPRISSMELIAIRKQEMEDTMLPNQVTIITTNTGKNVPVFSREVR